MAQHPTEESINLNELEALFRTDSSTSLDLWASLALLRAEPYYSVY